MASDNFNRADGPLGANWTAIGGGLAIVSNQIGAALNGSSAYTGAGAMPVDMFSQITMTTITGGDAGPAIRSNGSSSTIYIMDIGETAGESHLYKEVAGSFTLLNNTAHTFAANDVVYIQAKGTNILTQVNGTQIQSITDSSIDGSTVGGPYPAVYSASGLTMDDWSGNGLGPTINSQPSNQTVWEGQTATFSVSATTSSGPLTYQWFRNGVSIGGANSSNYTTPAVNYSTNNGDTYYCAVTDSISTNNTTTALLTVLMVGTPCWIKA